MSDNESPARKKTRRGRRGGRRNSRRGSAARSGTPADAPDRSDESPAEPAADPGSPGRPDHGDAVPPVDAKADPGDGAPSSAGAGAESPSPGPDEAPAKETRPSRRPRRRSRSRRKPRTDEGPSAPESDGAAPGSGTAEPTTAGASRPDEAAAGTPPESTPPADNGEAAAPAGDDRSDGDREPASDGDAAASSRTRRKPRGRRRPRGGRKPKEPATEPDGGSDAVDAAAPSAAASDAAASNAAAGDPGEDIGEESEPADAPTGGRGRKKAKRRESEKTSRPSVRRELFINVESLETRVAVLENGHLESFQVERNTGERISGNIYRGRIHNLQQSLQAAFVDIGESRNAFLHYWDMIPRQSDAVDEFFSNEDEQADADRRVTIDDIPRIYPPGKDILIQVTKGPIGNKGARVTANVTLPGRYLVLLPQSPQIGVSRKIEDFDERDRLRDVLRRLPVPKGMGLIVRTVGHGHGIRDFSRDLKILIDRWGEVEEKARSAPVPSCIYREPDLIGRVIRDSLIEDASRIVIDSRERHDEVREQIRRVRRALMDRLVLHDDRQPIFDRYGIERQVENVFRRKVWLKSGGYIVVDETEAMVAIDVNSGRSRGGKDQSATILDTNLEACDEVARQLRLRNVGGLIVVDFIDMKSRTDRSDVLRRFRDALKHDRAKTKVLPISMLGLIEMTRQRVEESVRESYFDDCPYCSGRGLVKSPLSMSVEIQRRVAEILRRRGRDASGRGLRIIVHPWILRRLRDSDEEILIELEKRLQGKLMFRSDPDLHHEEFRILDAETREVLAWEGRPDVVDENLR